MKTTPAAFIAGACVLATALAIPAFGQPVGWDIPLQNGWNLIAFPVTPADPEIGSVLSDLIGQGELEAIWTHDAATGEWRAFIPGNPVPGLPAITEVETGRGYWIKVLGNPTLSLTSADPPAPVSSLSELTRDWNLVASSAGEPKPYDRVFEGVPVRELWTFDAAGGVFQGVVLPPTGVGAPVQEDFTDMQPDQGYWVLVDPSQPGTVAFGPDLGTAMPGDVDVMPLLPPAAGPGQSVPWSELTPGDEDIGLDGFYDSPITQRALTFRNVAEVQSIAVFNEGTGVLSYTATVDEQSPLCDPVPASPLPWLSFRVDDPLTGEQVDLPSVAGSVATESASLRLVADRVEVTPGFYCAVVNISTNSVSGDPESTLRAMRAFIEIPELEGDYEVIAQIDSINGKQADTHSPRFHMSLYRDADGLKAIIDDQRTLLLPQRVRMIGDVYEDGTNRFILSGSFAIDESNPANPYDAVLRRDLSFVARRRERADPPGSGFGPLDLVGEYGETIRGPLGEPVFLSGTFSAGRADPEPSTLDEALAQSLGAEPIPDGGTAEYELEVTDQRLINEVIARLDLTHTSPEDLWIRLEPPTELGLGELTLRRNSDNVLGLISFEETQTSVDDLGVLSGLLAAGTWTLRVEDESINGEVGQVTLAQLQILGTRVVNLSGTVAGVGEGAIVLLTGCGLALTTSTDASGQYAFDNLIDCAYKVSVQADGFELASADVIIDPDDVDVVVDLAPSPGPPIPDTNVKLPCEANASNVCVGLAIEALSTSAGSGALLPQAQLAYVFDAATFDVDRPPLGQVGLEDTDLFSDAENPVTLTNACVTPWNDQVQSSTCIQPGDADIDPAIGVNSAKVFLAIGGPVIGRSVSGSHQLLIGVNP